MVKSVKSFEDKWIQWWSVIQPEWRETRNWPFAQEDSTGKDWGDLPRGGKDGLYIVVVSLGWWIRARDPLEDSKVDGIITDVAWVIDSLISLLSTDTTDTDSTPEPPPATPPRKRSGSVKVGPPRKRAKRAYS